MGAILIQIAMHQGARQMRGWESILFGDLFSVGHIDAILAWGVAGIVVGSIWATRRRMLFWAFDEAAAPAFGVPAAAMKYLLITLLAVAIVTAMKLAGVVLATALLVLPGAVALRLSDRYHRVVLLAAGAALVGVMGGLVLSFESDLPPGACIVAVLVVLFGAARVTGPALAPAT
jgi:ABC-type Mn2+/Zn2+ transport system permease subunit